MRFLNSRLPLALFVLFALVINSSAQEDALFLKTQAVKDEVARLLQTRDVGDLANEVAQQKSTEIPDLLKKLIVFNRAGHRARVLETFKQIVAARDFENFKVYLFEPMQEAAGLDDLATRKLFYEHMARGGDQHVESFTQLWRRNGNVVELEKWLEARALTNDTWWWEWFKLKKSLGAEEEVYAALEREIRSNPENSALIVRYLKDGDSRRSVAWLAAVVPTESAWQAYALARSLSYRDPSVAAKLFEKSLSLPFTEKDREKFQWYIASSFAMPPQIKNPEKQLRFWTKKSLAEIYRKTNQPQRAQPLVEELAAMDMSDILRDDVSSLAGMVQAVSGQRVVEAKILQEEAQKQDSAQYWIERAQYYVGRREEELVWQAFTQALEKFPYQAADPNASSQRLQILRSLAWYGENAKTEEVKEIFRREFARAAEDENYLFQLGRIIKNEYESFLGEFFLKNDLLPRVLAVRPKWRNEESALIDDVVAELAPKEREPIWNKLEALARRDIRNRAYALAEVMRDRSQHRKAIALLEELLKIAPVDFEDGLNYNREYVQKALFDAYLAIGDWRSAEKMFLGGFDYWKDSLNKIALVAARQGDVQDAVRLWKMNAGRDRQNLWHLEELAKTGAREALREFYLEMKKRDPVTDVPDKALRILQ